ncbi:proteophosphoglycan ppg3, putative, partial [Leishmania panamensis]
MSSRSSRHTRQHSVLVAALLCVTLSMLASVGAHSASDGPHLNACASRVPYYTAVQQEHTRLFLDAMKVSIPALASVWTCNNFCAHEGVECTKAGLKLRLDSGALSGSLPEIPESIDGPSVVLTEFTFFGHGDNLKGTLPASWYQLTSLSSFVLTSSGIAGTLPEMWGTPVESRAEKGYGAISRMAKGRSAQQKSSLRIFRAAGSNISGPLPASWSQYTTLEEIHLQDNPIEGTLPASWSSLINLRILNLTNTNVTGTLPESWGAMQSLQVFHAKNNKLYGTLPASWGSLSALNDLQLIGNLFTGIISQEWGQMNALRRISLQLSQCTCVPESWITKKVDVTLYSTDDKAMCEITSVCPSSSSSAPSSSSSALECDGPIPFYSESQQVNTRSFLEAFKDTIEDLQPLWTCMNFCVWPYVLCTPAGVAVEITGTEFFGHVPEVSPDVDTAEVVVTKLDFSHSMWVEGDYPASWASLHSLEHVSFAYTAMSGTLPSEWGDMDALRYLDLSFTWTNGMFPQSWSHLAKLEVLNLMHLTLPDHPPDSWSHMTALRELNLASTRASGTLPASWSSLKNLEILSLSNNNMVGSLPEQWGSLKQLATLMLHKNYLGGSIPEIYNDMTALTRASLEDNRFCGCLPSVWSAQQGVSMTITAQKEVLASDCATT